MNNLVAFGCSHTFGMGLEDIYQGKHKNFVPGEKPSNQAWPQLIANKLGLNCINKGICAASNIQILNEIVSYNYKNVDKVYVLWTTPYRDLLKYKSYNLKIGSFLIDQTFTKEELYNSIIPGVIDSTLDPNFVSKTAQKYFSIHDLTDMEYRSWMYQFTAGMFFEKLNIPFVFATAWSWGQNKTPFASYIKSFNILNQIENFDYALDDRHFGPKTHFKIADILSSL